MVAAFPETPRSSGIEFAALLQDAAEYMPHGDFPGISVSKSIRLEGTPAVRGWKLPPPHREHVSLDPYPEGKYPAAHTHEADPAEDALFAGQAMHERVGPVPVW